MSARSRALLSGVFVLLLGAGGPSCVRRAAPLFSRGHAPVLVEEPVGAKACGGCHPREEEAWSKSRHAHAWSDPLFQASFARARMRSWCTRCHAPLRREPSTVAAGATRTAKVEAEGVTCVVCHVRGGEVLSARSPTPAAVRAHPTREEPELRRSELCGGCHQFAVPVLDHFPIQDTDVPAQDTLHEWARAGVAQTCQDCHFAGHQVWGAHDLAKLAASIQVEVTPQSVTLTTRGVGHALPTGDPFRALVFEACADEACREVLRRWGFTRWLEPRGAAVVERKDTRLLPGKPRTLPLPPLTRSWRLLYRFAEDGLEGRVPDSELVTVLAEGSVRAVP